MSTVYIPVIHEGVSDGVANGGEGISTNSAVSAASRSFFPLINEFATMCLLREGAMLWRARRTHNYKSLPAQRIQSQRTAAKRKQTVSDEDPVDGDTDAAPPKKKQKVTKGSTGRAPRRVQVVVPPGASLVLSRAPPTKTKSGNGAGGESGDDLREGAEAGDEAAADFDDDSEPPTDGSDCEYNDDNYNGDSD
ncbi:hypothetical protein B0H14DRAFT_2579441 [Mycena olivaceomarginata]|nr:hypothetical protein B0H14DRAFT_2579441 [Mycena olivaceomarginata]